MYVGIGEHGAGAVVVAFGRTGCLKLSCFIYVNRVGTTLSPHFV